MGFAQMFGTDGALCWCEGAVWVYFAFEAFEGCSATVGRAGGAVNSARPRFVCANAGNE